MKSPFEGSISSLRAKRQELFLNYPNFVQSQHVSTPSRREYSLSKMSTSEYNGRITAINNESEVETAKSDSSRTAHNHLLAGVLWVMEGQNKDISYEVNSGIFTGAEDEHMRNDGLGTSRLKINFELDSQGLPTPINVQKLAVPIGYSMVATTEVTQGSMDQMVVALKEVADLSPTNNNRHSIYSRCLTPQSTHQSGLRIAEDQHGLLIFRKSLSLPHADLFVKKRKGGELHLQDGDPRNETGRNQKSPKVMPKVKDGNSEVSLHSHIVSSQAGDTNPVVPEKCWKDICARVSAVTSQQFSSSVGVLNPKEIDIFEDMLGTLQMSRKYESLCVNIQSTGKHPHSDHMHHQRVTEARFLQDMFLFQRVKLILMRAKRDVLLKKAEMIHSGIEECRQLRTVVPVKKHSGCQSALKLFSSFPDIKNQEERTIISLKKEELGALERKLMGLIQFFEGSCKLKGNDDCGSLTSLVNDYLNKRRCCRDIRHHLLLWFVEDIVIKKDECAVVLNYRDFLSQSFSIKARRGFVSSFRNSLSDVNIKKKFPNMKAYAAFDFVFSAMIQHNLADSECFQKVTQRTSFLLSNMLDLLEEIQAVRLATPNLIRTIFHSSIACQLWLGLCFSSGRELTLTLDMSELNCGVYPLEPSKLQTKIIESQTTVLPSTSDEIMSAIQRLEGGRLMITRLCRCVSDIVGSLL